MYSKVKKFLSGHIEPRIALLCSLTALILMGIEIYYKSSFWLFFSGFWGISAVILFLISLVIWF